MTIENSLKKLLREQLKKELCEREFHSFVKEAFKKVLDPFTIYKDNWHIKEICDYLQSEIERIVRKEPKEGDFICNVPPRSLKSIIMSVCLNAWAWIRYPHLRFITSSHGRTLSVELSADTQRLIESDWYQDNWGDSFSFDKKDWGKSYFKNTSGGFRKATSVGAKILGSGADVIVIDDPLDPAGSDGEVERLTAIEYLKSLATRLNDQDVGLNILVMQRLHEGDPTGYWLKTKKNIIHYQFPARLIENEVIPARFADYYVDGFLFRDRFSAKWLDNMKDVLGSKGYANQFGQRSTPDEGDIIHKSWFRYYNFNELPKELVWNFTVDTSYGEDKSIPIAVRRKKSEPDYNAVLCWATHGRFLYIRSYALNRLDFPDFCKFLPAFTLKNGYTEQSRIYIEPKASGKSIVQQLRVTTSLNVIEDKPPTDDKVTRMKAESAKVEAGRVHLPHGETWIEDFLYYICLFPNVEIKDLADTFSMACRLGLRKQNKVDYGASVEVVM